MFFPVFIVLSAAISAITLLCLAATGAATTVLSVIIIAMSITTTLTLGLKLPSIMTALQRKKERGTVKWFNASKGYGFITTQDGADVFVHFRSLVDKGRRNLGEGQTVEFVLTEGEKGPQAEQVSVVK